MPTLRLPAQRHLLRRPSGPAPRPTGSRRAAARPGSGSSRRRRSRPPAPARPAGPESRAARAPVSLPVIGPHLARDAFAVVERPGLVDQHDRDAVADRVGEPGLLADQLVARRGRSAAPPWSAGRPAAPADAGRGPPRRSARSSWRPLGIGMDQWRALEPPGSASVSISISAISSRAWRVAVRRPRAAPASRSGSNGQIMHSEVTRPASGALSIALPVGLDAVPVEIALQHARQARPSARPAAPRAAGRAASGAKSAVDLPVGRVDRRAPRRRRSGRRRSA